MSFVPTREAQLTNPSDMLALGDGYDAGRILENQRRVRLQR